MSRSSTTQRKSSHTSRTSKTSKPSKPTMSERTQREPSPAPMPDAKSTSDPPPYPSPPSTEPSDVDEAQEESKFAAQAAVFNILSQLDRKEGEAVGVLHCSSCNQSFGNLKHLQQHFMFSIKHGEDPRELRDLYYKLWRSSWKTSASKTAEGAKPDTNGATPDAQYPEPMVIDVDEETSEQSSPSTTT